MTTIQKIFFWAGIIETFLIAIAILVAYFAIKEHDKWEKEGEKYRRL